MFKLAVLFASVFAFASAGTTSEGLKWLAENKNKEGVITLPSGLQYKVTRQLHPIRLVYL
jgi:hypothetical protein